MSIENNYEQLRCSDNERIILSALITTVGELDTKHIEDPQLYYSMYKRLSDNILTWLPAEVDVFVLEDRIISVRDGRTNRRTIAQLRLEAPLDRDRIEEKTELLVWGIDDAVEYLNNYEEL